jgi:AbrB family looped-hinge helix DNA binding protein
MQTVTVSPKYQVVIPDAIRKLLSIRPGQKVQMIPYHGHIEVIPVKPVKEMRGFLKKMDTTIERESDRI